MATLTALPLKITEWQCPDNRMTNNLLLSYNLQDVWAEIGEVPRRKCLFCKDFMTLNVKRTDQALMYFLCCLSHLSPFMSITNLFPYQVWDEKSSSSLLGWAIWSDWRDGDVTSVTSVMCCDCVTSVLCCDCVTVLWHSWHPTRGPWTWIEMSPEDQKITFL